MACLIVHLDTQCMSSAGFFFFLALSQGNVPQFYLCISPGHPNLKEKLPEVLDFVYFVY